MKIKKDTVVGWIAAALIIFGVQLVRQGKTLPVSNAEWKNIKGQTVAHVTQRRRGVGGANYGGMTAGGPGGGGISI